MDLLQTIDIANSNATQDRNISEKQPLLTKQIKNKSIFKGQFSIWWLISSILSLWFTLYKGVPLLFNKDTGYALFIHLISCTLISIQCIINLYFTPSMGPIYKKLHRFIGMFCFATTTLSTLFGLITTWKERYTGINIFSVAISVGGIIQVYSQIMAIYFIRKKDLKMHIHHTFIVFYACCMTPAYIRLPILLNMNFGPYWGVLGWVIPIFILRLAKNAFNRKRWI